MAKKVGSLFATLGLNSEAFKVGVNKANQQLRGFNKSLNRMQGQMKGFAKSLGPIGGLMAGAFAVSVISDAINIFKDFERSQSQLKAVLGGTAAEMEKLSGQAKELGGSTKFTASEVSSLQTELAKLGFRSDEIQAMTAATLDGAAALGAELGPQAALVGAQLKTFGFEADQAARINDVLAKAASSSALDFEKLSTALPIVASTANNAGVSFERVTAMLGKLTDRGLDASTSATSLRNIFLELSKQGITWEGAMKKINSAQDKNKVSLELFGKRAATAATIMSALSGDVKEGQLSLEDLENTLNDASGAAGEMAEIMEDNLGGSITKASSAYEGMILSFEDGSGVVAQTLRSFVDLGATIFGFVGDLVAGRDAYGKWLDIQSGGGSFVEESINNVKELGLIMGTLNARVAAGTITQDQANAALEEYSKNGVPDAIKATKELQEAISGTGLSADEQKKNFDKLLKAEKKLEKQAEKAAKASHKLALEQEQLRVAALLTQEAFDTAILQEWADEAEAEAKKAKDALLDIEEIFPDLDIGGGFDNIPEAEEKDVSQAELVNQRTAANLEKASATFGQVAANIGNSMGEASSVITSFATGDIVGGLTGAFSLLIGKSEALQEILGLVNEVLDGVFTQIAEVLDQLLVPLKPLIDVFLELFAILNPISAVLMILEPVLQLLAPAFEVLGKVVGWIAGIFQSVGDFIRKIFGGKKKTNAAPALAGGALAFGPTQAIVGDNTGARVDPEVIAPLSKLQGMMSNVVQVTGEFVLRGDSLIALIDSHEKTMNSTQ